MEIASDQIENIRYCSKKSEVSAHYESHVHHHSKITNTSRMKNKQKKACDTSLVEKKQKKNKKTKIKQKHLIHNNGNGI